MLTDTVLSPRMIVAMIATVIACLVLLVHMGNPEPALPRCSAHPPTDVIRCEP